MAGPRIAVIATLDSKADAAQFLCDAVRRGGGEPWPIDVSLRPHEVPGATVSGGEVVAEAGRDWAELSTLGRNEAAEAMIEGGRKLLRARFDGGDLAGVVAIGGANGTTVACAMMRALPPTVPKVMVTPVAATAAVTRYVAEADIVMVPSISDIMLNHVTRAIMENAGFAVAAMARAWLDRQSHKDEHAPAIGLSTFGGVAPTVDRITELLKAKGYEVMHFHASGPGGKALESLAAQGAFAGVIDLTTSELTDLLTGGVYSAGEGRLISAGAAGIPQVIAPGCLDHTNWWTGEVPERFRHRHFHQYNADNLLMRTDKDEMVALGELIAERLNTAKGPFAVLIPTRGFSQHTARKVQDIDGKPRGDWFRPETDAAFADSLKSHLKEDRVRVLDMHINDREFADACVDALLEMMTP
jgi:uncharacterized protein (UPF0261 family)